MTADPAALRRALADQLHTAGALTDPAWRTAVENVPRELFLDTALFRQDGAQWAPVRRIETGPEEWLRLVYTDATWVTQVDGVEASQAPGPVSGNPTSSSTLPSLVVRTLEAAGIADGSKVLEIGTGTGYSTAILCHRLGEDHVTSIEYDPALARRAAEHLAAAGYHPTLITGDGLQGYKDGAEYDAIVATCAVRHIPPSWLWQLADHGSITTTLSGWMMASGLIRLTLTDDGTARGRFTGEPISYMLARPHERPPRPALFRHSGQTRTTPLDPAVLHDWTGRFIAQLAAPSAELIHSGDDAILQDVATGSQAWTERTGTSWTVHQHGPLHLWDQIEEAVATWQQAGNPDQSHFGMTISPDAEEQYVWLGDEEGPHWPLPC